MTSVAINTFRAGLDVVGSEVDLLQCRDLR
jgi:hypothetical protein